MSNVGEKIAGRQDGARGAAELFRYPACPGVPPLPQWNGWEEAASSPTDSPQEPVDGRNGDGAGGTREESASAFEAGRRQGLEEGRAQEREAHGAAVKTEDEGRRREYAKLAAEFAAASQSYLNAVEHEVVKLALAVAARILRREAQMDPLLLTGAVRVALGQLAANSEVRLRVPLAQAQLWSEAMALVPNRAVKPVVVADERMRLGDCIVESKAGTVDLGVRSQLGEIERGFFDCAQAGREDSGGPQPAAIGERKA
jgi:flagellar assembly protein FliH